MILVSFCRSEEVTALVAFIAEHWKADHIFVRRPDLLRWQYDPDRFAGAPEHGLSFLLARDADRIVGMLGLNELGFNVFGERRSGVWTSLWYASQEYRSQALGARLWSRLMTAGYEAVCMMGMNPAVRPFFESLGYELLIETPRWCGVLDRDAAEQLLSLNPAASVADVRSATRSLAVGSRLEGHDPASDDVESADWSDATGRAWDVAWRTSFAPRLIGSDKPAEYIAWRYVRHPIYQYRVQLACDRVKGGVQGLMVSRIEVPRGHDARVLRIVDLLGEPRALRVLATASLREACANGVAFADFHAVSARFAAPLEELGFERVDTDARQSLIPQRFQPLQFGERPLTSAFRVSRSISAVAGKLLSRDDFHVSRADGDQDRPS